MSISPSVVPMKHGIPPQFTLQAKSKVVALMPLADLLFYLLEQQIP